MAITDNHVRNNKTSRLAEIPQGTTYILLLSAIVPIVTIAWSYWPTIRGLYSEWQKSPDSSVGMLVPLIAIFLLWYDRKKIMECPLNPSWVWGIIIIVMSQILRIWSLLFFYLSGVRYSLVIVIAGMVLLIAGWKVFKTVFWIILILFLMVPSPTSIQNLINSPLQDLASIGTVFILEAFSIEVIQEGNILMLNDNVPMGVAEACNGLRLLTAFIIVTATLTYLMKCSRPRKLILLLSSIPIALICNIVRLCLTAAFMLFISVEVGEKFFHDFAGLSMMPIAVLLLFAELKIIDKIFTPEHVTKHSQTQKNIKNIEIHAKDRLNKGNETVISRNR